jgi:hypothetical protein
MGPFRVFLPSLSIRSSHSTGIRNLLLRTQGLLSFHGSSSPQSGFFMSCRSHRFFSTSNSTSPSSSSSTSGTAPALSFYATRSHCRACGIVGMPNVGKSTLFNALTKTQAAQASNYPFCTIEPNLGRVVVPDDRLEVLSSIEKSQKLIPLQIVLILLHLALALARRLHSSSRPISLICMSFSTLFSSVIPGIR